MVSKHGLESRNLEFIIKIKIPNAIKYSDLLVFIVNHYFI